MLGLLGGLLVFALLAVIVLTVLGGDDPPLSSRHGAGSPRRNPWVP